MVDRQLGWRLDPSGRHELRYFDGSTWTPSVADRGIVATEASGPTARWPSRVHVFEITLALMILAAAIGIVVVARWPTAPGSDAASAPNSGTSSPLSLARHPLLVESDFPSGWTWSRSSEGGSSENRSQFPGQAQLAGCLGVSAGVLSGNEPSASSPQFVDRGDGSTVQDAVTIYRSARATTPSIPSLANPKAPSCLASVLNGPAKVDLSQGFGSGASLGTIVVTRAPATDFAPGSANFAAELPVNAPGVSIDIHLVVVDYVNGTEEQTIVITSARGLLPRSLSLRLTGIARSRI